MVFTFSHLEETIKILSGEIRKQDFLTYFKKFSLLGSTEESLTLGVVSSFHRDNIARKFYDEIKKAVQTIAPKIEVIDIQVDEEIETKPLEQVIDCRDIQKSTEKQTKKEMAHGVEVVEGVSSRVVNDRYKLENFII
jgi:chromosomal replication initiation ATPase DnaA